MYINALDECDEDDIREAVKCFEDLGSSVQLKGVELYICFASRYYPNITMHHYDEIHLDTQKQHDEDISIYIQSKLERFHPYLDREIVDRIQARSSGVFLWVLLVVRMLKKKIDKGATLAELLSTIEEVPAQLRGLFREVLRCPDEALRQCSG